MEHVKNIGITGAGLVGSLLAIYLAKRGYKVSVFERRGDMRKHSLYSGRSINLALSNRGLRALAEVGMAEQLKTNAIPMKGRLMHDIQGELTYQAYGREGQYINSVSRAGLNMVLMDEAERLGVEFLFDHRCTQVDFEKTELTLQQGSSSFRRTFDWIFGSDGAFSAVRLAMQLSDRFELSQHYIEHGYKELRIPPNDAGGFLMEPHALHIWPRDSFMLIALPNPDGTFTCTLFLPFEGPVSFEQLTTDEAVTAFFQKYFPDVIPLMPTLHEDFRDNPTGSLVTVRSYPWVKNRTTLIGDAAHAIVPFYGQGMNAGFEDCRVLNDLLNTHADNWSAAMRAFQELRKPDADAVAQLALDNFVEMRDLVGDEDFLFRKKIEAKLHELFPDRWVPLYSMVTFRDDIRYSTAYAVGQKQKQIMDEVMKKPGLSMTWLNLDFEDIVSRLE
jgi:kynurenine 3-monooxygenase